MREITEDYLAAEDALVSQLEQLTEIKKVYRSMDLAEVEERAQVCPACHVLYWGDQLTFSAQGGLLSHITQTWVVVLAVKLGRNDSHPGELLAKVIRAVQGHKAGALSTFKRANAPTRPGYSKGYGYYPLAFTLTFKLKGTPP